MNRRIIVIDDLVIYIVIPIIIEDDIHFLSPSSILLAESRVIHIAYLYFDDIN